MAAEVSVEGCIHRDVHLAVEDQVELDVEVART